MSGLPYIVFAQISVNKNRFVFLDKKQNGTFLLEFCFLISLVPLPSPCHPGPLDLTTNQPGICHDFALDVFDGHVFGGYLEWFVHGLALWSILQYDATPVARGSVEMGGDDGRSKHIQGLLRPSTLPETNGKSP